MIKFNVHDKSMYGNEGRGGSSYSNISLATPSGHNQIIYRVPDTDKRIIKVLKDEFHGDSPHSSWYGERRASAAVDAYTRFPRLFPATYRIGTKEIEQERVDAGTSYKASLKNGDNRAVRSIFGNLKSLHDAGYIHGDVTGENIGSGQVLSVDTETFGFGDRSYDLIKARRVARENNRLGIADGVITDLYGQDTLEQLRRAA